MFMSEKELERKERRLLKRAISTMRIPTPRGEIWDRLMTEHNLPPPKPYDSGIFSFVVLPEGWKIKVNPADPYKRTGVILDNEEKQVGMIFVKVAGGSFRGSTTFYE